MATPPIIIGDDGSPPLASPISIESVNHLRVGRKTEPMKELKRAKGRHPMRDARKIENVTITQGGKKGQPIPVQTGVEVKGDLNTSITVKMESGKVVVSTTGALNEEPFPGSGSGSDLRYVATDAIIEEVIIDGDATQFTPNGKLVRVDIALS